MIAEEKLIIFHLNLFFCFVQPCSWKHQKWGISFSLPNPMRTWIPIWGPGMRVISLLGQVWCPLCGLLQPLQVLVLFHALCVFHTLARVTLKHSSHFIFSVSNLPVSLLAPQRLCAAFLVCLAVDKQAQPLLLLTYYLLVHTPTPWTTYFLFLYDSCWLNCHSPKCFYHFLSFSLRLSNPKQYIFYSVFSPPSLCSCFSYIMAVCHKLYCLIRL